MCRLAVARFADDSTRILKSWGVMRAEDIGEIVYNLVEAGFLVREPCNSKEDFRGRKLDLEKVFI